MTTLEIARRLDARERGAGWLARCPAHDDRRPSLSLTEGRGGKTLLRCFAGCEVDAIVLALGLSLTDLFADSGQGRRLERASIETAQSALDDELARVLDREEERLGFRPPILARHKNEARAAVERRIDVRLVRHASPWWEIEPHCVDPAWRGCVDRAVEEAAWRHEVEVDWLLERIETMAGVVERVLTRAREIQCSLAAEVA